jgi:hypothetical protein
MMKQEKNSKSFFMSKKLLGNFSGKLILLSVLVMSLFIVGCVETSDNDFTPEELEGMEYEEEKSALAGQAYNFNEPCEEDYCEILERDYTQFFNCKSRDSPSFSPFQEGSITCLYNKKDTKTFNEFCYKDRLIEFSHTDDRVRSLVYTYLDCGYGCYDGACLECKRQSRCIYQDYAGGVKECGTIDDGCGGTIVCDECPENYNCVDQPYAGGIRHQCVEAPQQFCYYLDENGERYSAGTRYNSIWRTYIGIETQEGTFYKSCDGDSRVRYRCGVSNYYESGEGAEWNQYNSNCYVDGCNPETGNCCKSSGLEFYCDGDTYINISVSDCIEEEIRVEGDCSELGGNDYTCYLPEDNLEYWNNVCAVCGSHICEKDGVIRTIGPSRSCSTQYPQGEWTDTGEVVTGPNCEPEEVCAATCDGNILTNYSMGDCSIGVDHDCSTRRHANACFIPPDAQPQDTVICMTCGEKVCRYENYNGITFGSSDNCDNMYPGGEWTDTGEIVAGPNCETCEESLVSRFCENGIYVNITEDSCTGGQTRNEYDCSVQGDKTCHSPEDGSPSYEFYECMPCGTQVCVKGEEYRPASSSSSCGNLYPQGEWIYTGETITGPNC